MSEDQVVSKAGRCKLGILVLGMLVVVLGIHSHYECGWTRYMYYENCDRYKENSRITKCPGPSMERYFVAAAILTYIFSVLNLVIHLAKIPMVRIPKIVDAAGHAVAAFLLIVGAIVFLVSTEQIEKITTYWTFTYKNEPVKFLRSEKLAAGSFAVIQSILYGLTALLIFME